MSPFRQRSQIASRFRLLLRREYTMILSFRSTTYLDVSYGDHLVPPSNSLISNSMLDIPRRPSLMPRTEPSLVGKAFSYSDLPHSAACIVNPSTGDANSASGVLISESSSVEWLWWDAVDYLLYFFLILSKTNFMPSILSAIEIREISVYKWYSFMFLSNSLYLIWSVYEKFYNFYSQKLWVNFK